MSFIDFLCGECPENYFDKYLKICKNLEKLPRELRNCNCCERHKQDFPKLTYPLTKYNKNKERVDNECKTKCKCKCKCPCRHIARHLCREWDTLNNVEDIPSTEEESEDYEPSDDSAGSLDKFIVPDDGLKRKERKELDKELRKLRKR